MTITETTAPPSVRDWLLALIDDAAGYRLRHSGDFCRDCTDVTRCGQCISDEEKAGQYEALYRDVENAPSETGALGVFLNAAVNGGRP